MNQIIKIIDFRDSLSSISLLKVTQVLGKMSPSEILEIRGVDSDSRQDLFKVLPEAAYEIIPVEEDPGTEKSDRICIRKLC